MVLDVGGIFEPTPFCDIGSGLIALYRRHWGDAIISVVSVLPWAGDTAKLAKFPGYLKTISRVTELAAKNPEFAKRVRPALEKLGSTLDSLHWDYLPAALRNPLSELNAAVKKGITACVPRAVLHRHHPLPKFLGGIAKQTPLTRLDPKIHTEFHRLLRENLRNAGIPLNVGGHGGSAADWARYMNANPGAQRGALDAVLDASRSIDAKHGTNIVQDVWKNIMDGNFTSFP